MKHLAIITSSLLLLTSSLSAGVPLRWTVETSRAQPATFDEFAGATYDLEATLQSYGKPLEVVGEPHLYWQTNGMGSAYWTATATVSGNVLRATWTPACDVGARAYNCFIGITGTVYNAAFQLRLRPSPGAVPNVIDQPPRVLDLEHTIVINPPWPTDETISERIREVIDEDGITAPVETNVVTSIITNTVTKQFVEDLGISGGGSSGVDTNAVCDIALWPATNYTDRATGEVIRSVGALADTKRDKTDFAVYALSDWDYNGYSGAATLVWFEAYGIRPSGWYSNAMGPDVGGTCLSTNRFETKIVYFDPGSGYEITATRSFVETSDTLAKTSDLSGKQDALTSAQLANIDAVPKKADEYVWECDPSISPYRVHWIDAGVAYEGSPAGWTVGIGDFASGDIKGDESSDSLEWADSEWVGGFAFTATRKRVLRTGDVEPPGNYASVSNAALSSIQHIVDTNANLIFTITGEGRRFYFTPIRAINPED